METSKSADNPLSAPSSYHQCPACESAIPPHLVFINFAFNKSGNPPARRTLTINCPHCDRFWSRTDELQGVIWQPITDVAEVTDAKKLAGLNRRVDRLTNTTRALSA